MMVGFENWEWVDWLVFMWITVSYCWFDDFMLLYDDNCCYWWWWIHCVVMWWSKPCLFMNVTVLRSMLILNDCSWINDVMWWLCWVSVVIPCWLWVLSVLYVDLRVNKFWGRNFGLGDQNWVFTWNREKKNQSTSARGVGTAVCMLSTTVRLCASVFEKIVFSCWHDRAKRSTTVPVSRLLKMWFLTYFQVSNVLKRFSN